MMLAQIESSLARIADLRKWQVTEPEKRRFKFSEILTSFQDDESQPYEYRGFARQMLEELKLDIKPASVEYLIQVRWPVAIRVILQMSQEATLLEVSDALVHLARRYELRRK